jgi:hypothetical protein
MRQIMKPLLQEAWECDGERGQPVDHRHDGLHRFSPDDHHVVDRVQEAL